MMKIIRHCVPAVLVMLAMMLAACSGQNTATWQEQYDLGVRYLSEGNYEEAIIAFTAAIEIDPNRAEAYAGRGDAYVASGETEENLAAALADYEAALELDETLADAWLGLADIYIRKGVYDKALEVLQEGLEATGGNEAISEKIAEIESGSYIDSADHLRRSNRYNARGIIISYTIYQYDSLGRRCYWENYDRQYNDQGEVTGEFAINNYCEVIFDERGQPSQNQFYSPDGTLMAFDTFVYDNEGNKVEQHRYNSDGTEQEYFLFYYNEKGQEIRYEGYDSNGMYLYWINEYDENGDLTGRTEYKPDGTVFGHIAY